MTAMILQGLRFGGVGVCAMAMHLCLVSLLVPAGMHPLLANAIGLLTAFQITFQGHRRWTFRTERAPGQYRRMFLVSCTGFAVNELLYAVLLRVPELDYRVSLAMVLCLVAAGTYAGSKFWVFRKA